ncbi:DsbC family protein [Hydrogenophaga sp. T2]|uniref:DsbC family protein n=1 Tax=Hydrogenophaga sp. T2 TaxID=3132823 RepID=UPI003CF775A7
MDRQRRDGLKHISVWAGLVAAGPVWAQAPGPRSAAALSAIVEALTGAKVEAIQAGPLPGLHEVIVRGKVLYIDDSGEHLIQGQIVEIAQRRSLTAEREAAYLRATTPMLSLKDLNLADAITYVRGKPNEGRVLVTFEDPRCGFCRQLHTLLDGMRDLTVHTFPVSFLGPESRSLNQRIWCSGSRVQSWNEAMAGKPVAEAAACEFGALDRNMALAERFRVRGTPTIFTATGRRFDGVVGLDAIESALASVG